jgi:hypothetical protein
LNRHFIAEQDDQREKGGEDKKKGCNSPKTFLMHYMAGKVRYLHTFIMYQMHPMPELGSNTHFALLPDIVRQQGDVIVHLCSAVCCGFFLRRKDRDSSKL